MADEETKVEETTETPAEETTEAAEEVKEEAPAAEEKAEESAREEKSEPTGKFADMIKQIEEMKVADLAELVKALEDRFGVSAAMPMAVAGAGAGAGAGGAEVEEKSSYTVMLKDGGAQKIAVIKAVREINQDLGLKEAKDLVDGAPKEIKKDIPKADAEEAKKKLEAAGATVELV
jgi:large subunit ribosomal protein L7/L12